MNTSIEQLIDDLPDSLLFNQKYYYFRICKKLTVHDGKTYCATYVTNENEHYLSTISSDLKTALTKLTEKLNEEGWL